MHHFDLRRICFLVDCEGGGFARRNDRFLCTLPDWCAWWLCSAIPRGLFDGLVSLLFVGGLTVCRANTPDITISE